MPPIDNQSSFSTSAIMRAPLTFFDLPAEVRNVIYRLVFPKKCFITPHVLQVCRDEIDDTDKTDNEWFDILFRESQRPTEKPARILRTSRSFNLEAAPFVYGTNEFHFSSLSSGIYFIKHIGKQNSAYITSLKVNEFWYPGREANSSSFKAALEASCECLAERCTRLSFLEIGNLVVSGAKKEWKIGTLEYLKILIDALPALSDVSYFRSPYFPSGWVYLKLPAGAAPYNGVVFDVDEEIRKRKEVTGARRCAGAKRAHATRRANRAVQP